MLGLLRTEEHARALISAGKSLLGGLRDVIAPAISGGTVAESPQPQHRLLMAGQRPADSRSAAPPFGRPAASRLTAPLSWDGSNATRYAITWSRRRR
jgi:hypothetical protein